MAITDAAGAVLEKRQFDAWGSIAQVQDGAGNVLNVLTILDRGYTSHEHLQSVGLIDMNARLYDPKLHRFLQPDNYVQDPGNTQNYNRYGYCWNNPLKYTDPSGEFFFVAMIVGAIIGAYIGGSKANDNWNPIKWDWSSGKTWAGMGTGAVIGAVAGEVAWAGVTGQLAFGIFNVSLGAGIAVPGVGTVGIFKSGEYWGSQFTNTSGQSYNQNIGTVPVVKPKSDDLGGGNGGEKDNDTVNSIRNFYNSNQAGLRNTFNKAEITGGTMEAIGSLTALFSEGTGLGLAADGLKLSLIGTGGNISMDFIEGKWESGISRGFEFGFYFGMGRAFKSGVPQKEIQNAFNAFQSYFSTYIMPVFKDSWTKYNTPKN